MSRLIYGVARAGLSPVTASGVAGAAVDLVTAGELAAAVSDAPTELLARRRDVTAHMDVLDELMRQGPVLPFRFGTVLDGDADVARLLEERRSEYAASLRALDNLVQVTVHLTHDEDAVVEQVMSQDRRLREYVRAGSRRTQLSDRIAVGERVAASVAAACEADQVAALDGFGRLAEATAVTSRADTDLAVSFLLQRNRLADADEAARSLTQRIGARARLDYAGPMPAYSFVG